MHPNNFNLIKFKEWLENNGAEVLPVTNDYELVRFKGDQVGVVYKTMKTANSYTTNALNCYYHSKRWDGRPINVGRKPGYAKEKRALIIRDGTDCFYCGLPLGDDITVEHLISLVSGGKNTPGNMVLAHEDCNQAVRNKTVVEKVKIALNNRIKLNSNESNQNLTTE